MLPFSQSKGMPMIIHSLTSCSQITEHHTFKTVVHTLMSSGEAFRFTPARERRALVTFSRKLTSLSA